MDRERSINVNRSIIQAFCLCGMQDVSGVFVNRLNFKFWNFPRIDYKELKKIKDLEDSLLKLIDV